MIGRVVIVMALALLSPCASAAAGRTASTLTRIRRIQRDVKPELAEKHERPAE